MSLLSKDLAEAAEIRIEAIKEFRGAYGAETHEEYLDLANDTVEIEKMISEGLLDEFVSGNFSSIADKKYDRLIIDHLKSRFALWSNEALLRKVQGIDPSIQNVTGDFDATACPCCGFATLIEAKAWEICLVCWWEDDGLDNSNADIRSGVNYNFSLTQGRINFLRHGVYDPERVDLLADRADPANYRQDRVFEIDQERDILLEKGTNWTAAVTK